MERYPPLRLFFANFDTNKLVIYREEGKQDCEYHFPSLSLGQKSPKMVLKDIFSFCGDREGGGGSRAREEWL